MQKSYHRNKKTRKDLEEKFNYVQETERKHEYIVREYNKLNEIRLLISLNYYRNKKLHKPKVKHCEQLHDRMEHEEKRVSCLENEADKMYHSVKVND